MPRYYFNIRQGNRVEIDHTGKDLHDLDTARDIAVQSVLALLDAKGKQMTGAVIEICGEDRQVTASVPVDRAAFVSGSRDLSDSPALPR
jgi:hypothetical protein